jgi:hypothetical protein
MRACSAPAARLYYLRVGVRLGHSPNPYFDEAFYLATNPDIAVLVREGAYASRFDHFCQYGHRDVSPHWLFDDVLYGALYEDMALEHLDQHHCHGRYDHYLEAGQFERATRRMPSRALARLCSATIFGRRRVGALLCSPATNSISPAREQKSPW